MKKCHAQVECAEKAAEMKAAAEQGNQTFAAREPQQRSPRQVRQRPRHRTRDRGADGDDDADEPERFHHLNPPELVKHQELLSFADLKLVGVPYSREHIWRLVRDGKFPKPVKFGGANSRCFFRRSEIQEWIERAA